jgi:hypothetical protein
MLARREISWWREVGAWPPLKNRPLCLVNVQTNPAAIKKITICSKKICYKQSALKLNDGHVSFSET